MEKKQGVYLSYESFMKLVDEKALVLSKEFEKSVLNELLTILDACENKSKDDLKLMAQRARGFYEDRLKSLDK